MTRIQDQGEESEEKKLYGERENRGERWEEIERKVPPWKQPNEDCPRLGLPPGERMGRARWECYSAPQLPDHLQPESQSHSPSLPNATIKKVNSAKYLSTSFIVTVWAHCFQCNSLAYKELDSCISYYPPQSEMSSLRYKARSKCIKVKRQNRCGL